ncbi:MAG: efflux RND transporter permease subunit [Bacteroides sp.]|nr:efflux RND transporter permease subunit [Bacteroides sp.]
MKLDRFINRPVLSTVISIIIVILGVLGLVSLPITQYPDIAPPTVQVSTTYTGANAQTILNSVIAPLEEQINGVENMLYMKSTATNTGSATIQVYFKQGTDPDLAAINVQNQVSAAQGLLPSEVVNVGVITSKRQTSTLMAFSLYSTNDEFDITFLENYAKINLIPQIQRVNGVGEAMVLGADYSMRIWLRPDVMAEYNVTPSDITAILAQQNVEAAPGQFGESSDQTFQYTLTYRGRLETEEEFGDIVVRTGTDGDILRLRDIADIELGRSTYGFSNRVNGYPGVTTMIFQTAGSNATTTIQSIEELLDNIRTDLPEGVKIAVLLNTNDFLSASIREVIKTLLEAFVLVFLVVYIFLQDFRSTLIPAIAIPVALIGTFFVLYLIGFSLNLLTLCAMILAIAIVVDDAIVVVEGVHAKLDQGYQSARQASIDAMSELSGPIISITLVMMSVFIPVSFIGGTSGTFYRQFGLTMAIAIGISAVNALTLSPALCALFLKPHTEEGEKKHGFIDRFHIAFNTAYDHMSEKYKNGVQFITRHHWITFAAVIASLLVLVLLMRSTPTALVPDEDTGTIFATVDMPPATSQERTAEVMNRLDSLIASNPAIESRTEITGYSFLAGQGSSYGTFICRLKNWSDRGKGEDATSIVGRLYLQAATQIKDARILFFAPPMIPGYSVTNGLEINLEDRTGGDLDKFYGVAQEFLAALSQRPEIAMAQTSFNPSFPQYMVEIDVARCMQAGISPSDILTTLQGYYGGIYASNFNRFGKLYRVMIQAPPNSRLNPESLNQVKIRNNDNEMAPITQFIDLRKVYGPDNITRFNLFTSITVNGSLSAGTSSGTGIRAVEEVAAQTLPTGYSYEFSGMTREEQSSGSNTTLIVFALCLIFVYLLLSAQYESYILPLTVILSIPFGLMGSFLFAKIMGHDNNIYMQIALIMLMGLLAKNAILITEFALDRRRTGMGIAWSAVLGAAARLRPILMTSLALVIGLLPLMFAHGVGANGNSTLGAASVGGMLIGMLCQIFIVPGLFVVFEYLQEKVKPLEIDDTDNSDAQPEIEQYSKK